MNPICPPSPRAPLRSLSRRDFVGDTAGSVYLMMAAALIPITGLMGGAVDFGRAYLVNSKLQAAVDAAAVVGVREQQLNSATGPGSSTWVKIEQYRTANFPNSYMGSVLNSPQIAVSRQFTSIKVDVDVAGHIPTTFLRVLGMQSLSVGAKATAQAGERSNAIEAMLVLDNTGSMASNGGMVAMKAAAKDFVNIVYNNQNTIDDVAIGMLPYNITVNVGRLLRASRSNAVEDYNSNVWRKFYDADPIQGESWKGCVMADPTKVSLNSDVNVLDADVFDIGKTLPGERTANGSVTMPPVRPFIYPAIQVQSFDTVNNLYKFLSDTENRDEKLINANPVLRRAFWDRFGDTACKNSQTGRDCDIDTARIPNYGTYATSKVYGHKSGQSLVGPSPNYECPSEALPVQYDRQRTALIKYIDEENSALPNIGTIHTPAMTWGYRLLARDDVFPRTKSSSRPVKRVLIFLTDGNFDSNDRGRKADGKAPFDTAYTAYGTYEDRLVSTTTTASSFIAAMIPRFSKTCQAAKRDGIQIYTITFALSNSGDGPKTKTMFKACATDPNTHYFETTNAATLSAAFRSIASDLVDLHLSR